MDPANVISELAALRDQFTVEQLLDMVVEGLGGKDAVAAELGEDEPDDEDGRDLTVMRDADVARLETIQTMSESFCTWLHAKGEEQMKQNDDAAVDKVRQLSASFNKAARAVRLSMVLKHEVAGLRPLPNVRGPAEPASGNNPAAAGRGGPGGVSADGREGVDTEGPDRERMEQELNAYLQPLIEALDEDIAAAPPDIQAEAKRESIAVKLTSIAASIPHPKLDRKIADIQLGKLWDSFAPRNAEKPEALGPPDLERVSHRRWNNAEHSRDRAAKAARRR
jgi:hypothetical protein